MKLSELRYWLLYQHEKHIIEIAVVYGMVWLGKWGVGCGGSGFELSVVRDGVGIRSAFHMSPGLGMEWCGLGCGAGELGYGEGYVCSGVGCGVLGMVWIMWLVR